MTGLIDLFEKEVECTYKGETYSVRDNGAVMRHSRGGKKPRALDQIWTFGSKDLSDGYAKICGQPVHRIVATAFHGEPPTPTYVVDHIDTNRQNNRPENLRWVTRLENVLLNPITRKKIEYVCGCSAEEILNDWSILHDKQLDKSFAWMHAVTAQEASKTLEHWNKWLEQGTISDKRKPRINSSTHIRDIHQDVYPLEPKTDVPSLEQYANKLQRNKVFYTKQYSNVDFLESRILDAFYDKEKQIIYVATMSNNDLKPFYLTEITINNNAYSYSGRSLFEQRSLDKYMTLARGEEWNGEDTIDDYC